MWISILIIVVMAFWLLVIIVVTRPADFKITRSEKMAAPPGVIFSHVNRLRDWEQWSPWAKMDPNVTNTYEGPEAGTGAAMAWLGNSKVGQGRMTITDSKREELVQLRLEFLKPMKVTNMAEFTFKPDGNQTIVTWTMSGKNGFMAKAFGLVMNFDKMVGGDFEKGLASIKALAEAGK